MDSPNPLNNLPFGPSHGQLVAMPGRPRRSCDGCNTQKLRCGGQKPICDRCQRLARACTYPATKNHKRTDAPPVPRTPASGTASTPTSLECATSRIPERNRQYYGVPSELVPALIDLYFTHIYNANLLFHRATFMNDLENNAIRVDVFLSICALASRFYTDLRGSPVLVENGFSHEWAEVASRAAFLELETPCHDNIVVFINLALYWYGVGKFQRTSVHAACASNTAWILGNPSDRRSNASPFEVEIRRRRFWGCYLLCSFQTDNLFPKVPTEAMLTMRLPCGDTDFQLGTPQLGVLFNSGGNTQSIYGELVRAMALWSAIVSVVKQPDAGLSGRLIDIQTLDVRIHQTRLQLAPQFHLEAATVATTPLSDLPNLLLLNIIYHQCWCSLHASIVPLFSWSASAETLAYAHQLSAQTAFEHANAISMLLEAAMHLQWDAGRMPSFIGFASYCACAIQIPYLWCAKQDIRQRAVRSILANLKTLQILGNYWAFLKILGRFACGIYKAHSSHRFPLEDEPKNMAPKYLKGFNTANTRATLSILAHNTIVISNEGFLSKGEDDVEGLGIVGSEQNGVGAAANENIAGVIFQISGEDRETSSPLPIILDPFVAPENLDFYQMGGHPGFDAGNPHVAQLGDIEHWISELLQEP